MFNTVIEFPQFPVCLKCPNIIRFLNPFSDWSDDDQCVVSNAFKAIENIKLRIIII